MHSTRRIRLASGPRRAALVALFAGLGVGAFGASPAHAKREFENGFQDQLGRLAAYEVVALGRAVLSGGYYHPYYHAPVHRVPYRQRRVRHVVEHHHHHHYAGEPCDVSYEVRRRGPHGERFYERYERRSRYDRDDDDDHRRGFKRRVRWD